jgi:hypothetical protein
MRSTTKTSKPKQFSIFDFIKALVETKPKWESFTPDQQKQFNGYMINKFLSMNRNYIDVVNYVQGLNIKDSKRLYEVYCGLLPKSKNVYSPYIKSTNKTSQPEVAQHISKYFECSLNEAEEYVSFLEKQDIEVILNKMGLNEKETKKLLKNG